MLDAYVQELANNFHVLVLTSLLNFDWMQQDGGLADSFLFNFGLFFNSNIFRDFNDC